MPVQTPAPFSEEQLLTRLNQLISIAQQESDAVVRLNVLQQVALLVNKFLGNAGLLKVEERLWHPVEGLFMSGSKSNESIRVGFWIVKGLVVRLAKIEGILGRVLDQLSDAEHGMAMAHGFELLLSPDEILAKENGATIGRLAPQKVFNLCLAEIKTRLRDIAVDAKPNYIIALSGLLKYLTESIITPRADELLPLLLQALDLPQPSVKEAAIQTLTILVKTSPESVESHAPSLINRLLNSAKDCGVDMVVC
jgi:DNA repair/transcription protein MET18/MMS19